MTSLDTVFSALSNSARRDILARLTHGEAALSDLAMPFEMTQTAVTKHVRILENAGLIEMEKRGRTRYCRLSTAPMKEAADWLQTYKAFWEERLDGLAIYVDENP